MFQRFLLECFTSLIHRDQTIPDTGRYVVLLLSQLQLCESCREVRQLQFQSGAPDGHSQLPPTKIPQEEPTQKGTTTRAREELSLCSSPSPLILPTERPGLFLAESGLCYAGLRWATLDHPGLPPPHSPPGYLTLNCFSSTPLALLWTEP